MNNGFIVFNLRCYNHYLWPQLALTMHPMACSGTMAPCCALLGTESLFVPSGLVLTLLPGHLHLPL